MLDTVMSPADQLLHLIAQTSFRVNRQDPYRLSSGRQSPYYVDCKMVLSYPNARQLMGELILERFAGWLADADAIGGLELSAYPLAVTVSDAAYRRDASHILRAFIVRKQPKAHGLTKQVEGLVMTPDTRVVIVDDVITTGASTIQAIRKCREVGLQVRHAIALIDREEDDGRQHIEAEGITFGALFTLAELSKAQEESEA